MNHFFDFQLLFVSFVLVITGGVLLSGILFIMDAILSFFRRRK